MAGKFQRKEQRYAAFSAGGIDSVCCAVIALSRAERVGSPQIFRITPLPDSETEYAVTFADAVNQHFKHSDKHHPYHHRFDM